MCPFNWLGLFVLPALAVATAATSSTPGSSPEGARDVKPRTASGRVVDVHGRPVAGATIEHFLDELRRVSDPAERRRRVLEIAAADDLPEIEEIFPYLGELRPELAAIAGAGTAEPKVVRDGASPAEHASRLLAYWADPADDALVGPWIQKNWGGRPAHVAHLGLAGASIDEVCYRWREIHFADQGISDQPPWSNCRELVLDRTHTHAVALFRVRYANWGYSMHLVLRREGERWVLRGVTEGTIEHYRREATDSRS